MNFKIGLQLQCLEAYLFCLKVCIDFKHTDALAHCKYFLTYES